MKEFISKDFMTIAEVILYTGAAMYVYARVDERKNNRETSKYTRILLRAGVITIAVGAILLVLGVVSI